MPQRAWSGKRERQYKHIKEGLLERGRSEDTAENTCSMMASWRRSSFPAFTSCLYLLPSLPTTVMILGALTPEAIDIVGSSFVMMGAPE